MRYKATLAGALAVLVVAVAITGSATATPYEPAKGKAHIFNHEQASGANILTTSLTPKTSFPVIAYSITVSLDTSVKFQIVSTDGTTTHVDAFNGDTALAADTVYSFLVNAAYSDQTGTAISYNFRLGGNAYIKRLQVDEIRSDTRSQ